MLVLVSLLLIGPLREAFSSVPLLPFLAALALFVTPGVFLARLLVGDDLPFVARVPVAFGLSVGGFGLIAVPMLFTHASLASYLRIGGVVVLVAALLAMVLPRFSSLRPPEAGRASEFGRRKVPLWIAFGILSAVLAFVGTRVSHTPNEDMWLYLTHIRDYVGRENLSLYPPYVKQEITGFTRMTINGWLVELAALSRLSGVDPVRLVLFYVTPALIVMGLLSVYSFALALFRDVSRALWAACLLALLFLVTMGSSLDTSGSEFVGRVTEDKFAARFLLMPVVLGAAVLFLRERTLSHLVLLSLLVWATPVVHPLGFAAVAMVLAGFGLLHVVSNPRNGGAWLRSLGMAAVVLAVVVPPAAYLAWSGTSPSAVLGGSDPLRDVKLLNGAQENGHLLVLGEGSYIMHPSLLLRPVVLGAYLAGAPFLLWRLRSSVPAQLLLGVLMLFPVLLYVPPVATFLAGLFDPWHLRRLPWPLPLASLLALSWVGWEAVGYVARRVDAPGGLRHLLAVALPTLVLVVLAVAAAPTAATGARAKSALGETAQDRSTCVDPAFSRLEELMTTASTVLAPDAENGCIPAYATYANVASYRSAGLLGSQENAGGSSGGGPKVAQGVIDVRDFFKSNALDEKMVETIRINEADFLLLETGSPLNSQLAHAPGFTPLDSPGERYRLYGVDRDELVATPVTAANGLLNGREWLAAADAYYGVLLEEIDEDQRFLALLGYGQAQAKRRQYEEVFPAYEAAAELAPKDPAPHSLAARAYAKAGDTQGAVVAQERAVELEPENVGLRLDLGEMLLDAGDGRRAVEEYRAVVERYPSVPEYRVELGAALLSLEQPEAGEEELERASSFDPLSSRIRGSVGAAYEEAGRLEEAASHYERVRELEPDSQDPALRLGLLYSRLSAQEEGDDGSDYFGRAEEELERVMNLEPSRKKDLRAQAQEALGDLYESRDQREKAAAAYERAEELKADPSAAEDPGP